MPTEMNIIERRSKVRFPLRRDLRYKVLEDDAIVAQGTGQTIDMSSSGVAFSIDQRVKTGTFIELSISWPALLDETLPMRLIVFGRVLRSGRDKSVSTIDKYEFRTQARVIQTTAPVRTDAMLQRWADGYRRENMKAREASA